MVDYISNAINKESNFNFQKKQPSELFEVSNSSSINASSIFQFDLEAMPYAKYIPFNYALVQNNSAQKIRFIINDSVRKIIPAGTIQSFDSSTIPAIWSIKIENLSTTTAIGIEEININFQKVQNIETKQLKLFGSRL